MKTYIFSKTLVLISILINLNLNAQYTDLNLDFENITYSNTCYGWSSYSSGITFIPDTINIQNGKHSVTARLKEDAKIAKPYAQMSLEIKNENFKNVELSGYMQTLKKGDVKLAIIVDNKRYSSKNAVISKDFIKYTVKASIKPDNEIICIVIGSDVKASFDNFSIKIDGKEYGIGQKEIPPHEIEKIHTTLKAFSELLKDNEKFKTTKTFAFGEGTHGTKEFHEFSQNASKELIKEYGVKNILLECSYYDGLLIDNYIQDITDTLRLREMKYWIYQNKEFETFVNWLRRYNLNQVNKVHIIGIDITDYGTSINDLISYANNRSNKFLLRNTNKLKKMIFSKNDIETGKRKESKRPINFLNKIIHGIDSTSYTDNKLQFHILTNYCNLLSNFTSLTRNKAMFENIKYFQTDNLPQIVFAHNDHVSDFKIESPQETVSFLTFTYSGTYTAVPQNSSHLSINTLVLPQVGSLEYYMEIIFKENTILPIDSTNTFLIKLIKETTTRNIGSVVPVVEFESEEKNVVNDYFIFIPKTTHAQTLNLSSQD